MVLKVSVLPDEICPMSAELLQWNSGCTEIGIVAQATGLDDGRHHLRSGNRA